MIAERLGSATEWRSFMELCLDERAMEYDICSTGPGSSYRRSPFALLTASGQSELSRRRQFSALIEL